MNTRQYLEQRKRDLAAAIADQQLIVHGDLNHEALGPKVGTLRWLQGRHDEVNQTLRWLDENAPENESDLWYPVIAIEHDGRELAVTKPDNLVDAIKIAVDFTHRTRGHYEKIIVREQPQDKVVFDSTDPEITDQERIAWAK